MIDVILFEAFGLFHQASYDTFSMSRLFYQYFSDSFRSHAIIRVFSPSSFAYGALPQLRTQT